MADLSRYNWDSIYESQPSATGSHLVDEFYVPALQRSVRYDRIAGYFSSSALAVAPNCTNLTVLSSKRSLTNSTRT